MRFLMRSTTFFGILGLALKSISMLTFIVYVALESCAFEILVTKIDSAKRSMRIKSYFYLDLGTVKKFALLYFNISKKIA